MRNKDKSRKKKKPASPPLPKRNFSLIKGSNDLTQRQEDYGFLNAQKCRTTKAVSNEEKHHNNGERRGRSNQRRPEIAKQLELSSKFEGPYHGYNKQSYLDSANDKLKSEESDVMTFYPQQITERQSRSVSRHHRQIQQHGTDCKAASTRSDRSRSKSRDIVALYTASGQQTRSRSSTPAGSLHSYIYNPPSGHSTARSRSCTPARSLASYQYFPPSITPTNNISRPTTPAYLVQNYQNRRSRSLARGCSDGASTLRSPSTDTFGRRAKSESRFSSISRDLISLSSNISTQSRALSNSEIASQNLELWMTTTSKNQRPSSKTRKPEKKHGEFVTMLEMDAQINEATEKLLGNSTLEKPANIKMMMIAGHTPTSDNWESEDEIQVKPGTMIIGLYKQNEWLFISNCDGKTGYVPYAYTKAVKITPLARSTNKSGDQSSVSKINPHKAGGHRHSTKHCHMPSSTQGILKTSKTKKTQPPRQFHPSSSKYTTASDRNKLRDSLSSNNSVFLEELMYARPPAMPRPTLQTNTFADCLVVDTDRMTNEDVRAYCSDSGISEPNSNHSDDIDHYATLSTRQHFQYNNLEIPNSRSSMESTLPQINHQTNRSRNPRNNSDSELLSQRRKNKPTPSHSHINFMPLGPLGERLQKRVTPRSYPMKPNTFEHPFRATNISDDMRSRAQPMTSQIPEELKPKIPKDYNGPRVRVIYDYVGDNDDDVEVRAGGIVTILNAEDVEWIWVMRKDGAEGFIPREYVLPLDVCRPKVPEVKRSQRHHMIVAL